MENKEISLVSNCLGNVIPPSGGLGDCTGDFMGSADWFLLFNGLLPRPLPSEAIFSNSDILGFIRVYPFIEEASFFHCKDSGNGGLLKAASLAVLLHFMLEEWLHVYRGEQRVNGNHFHNCAFKSMLGLYGIGISDWGVVESLCDPFVALLEVHGVRIVDNDFRNV